MTRSSDGGGGGRSAGLAVVLCALGVEYLALRVHLGNPRQEDHPAGTRFEVGELTGSRWLVALAMTGPGTIGAGVIAEQAIALFDPDVLMCVGVAGALKDDLELGDVVVATRVDAYHGGAVAEDFLARPRTWDASHRFEQAARHLALADGWRRWLSAEVAGTRPTVHFRPVAAGEVVLDNRDSAIFAQLRLHYNDAAAIEMEGSGIAIAAHINAVQALVIRGISDRADGSKASADRAGWQQRAAASAAAFAAALLSSFSFPADDARSSPAGRARVGPSGRDGSGSLNMLGEEYIVGRKDELSAFDRLLARGGTRRLLNVFGPSGIGKSAVRRKFVRHALHDGVLAGQADIGTQVGSPIEILRELTVTLRADPAAQDGPLQAFASSLDEYDLISNVIAAAGGIEQLYDIDGSPRDQTRLRTALDRAGGALPGRVREIAQNRYAFERYLRTAPHRFAASFGDALSAAMEGRGSAALLFDTYEEAGALDVWVRRTLLPAMPNGTRLVIFGRNSLAQQNFDWADHADLIQSHQLAELAEDEAKSYLTHYGLTDPVALDHVVRFTGGYPLLLVLVRQLAEHSGGWAAVGHLDASGDRDRIASQLLDRILREQRVHAVREVLEKCAIASWLNPEVIIALLDFSESEARAAFDEIRRFSFMERHPEGAMLHEKIRTLLVERLRFTSRSEYDRLEAKLLTYHAENSGL